MTRLICESPNWPPLTRGRRIIVEPEGETVTFVRCHTLKWRAWPEREWICRFADVLDVFDAGRLGRPYIWVTTTSGRAYFGKGWRGYRECVETLRRIAGRAPTTLSCFDNPRFLCYVFPIIAGVVILALLFWLMF